MNFSTKGSLAETGFISLLKGVSDSQLTGMVRLENGPVIKVVYLQRGTVSFASSNEKSDRLTEVLKRAGKLTLEQVQDAQNRLKPNVSLGKTLVELGYISAKDLLWGARAQVDGILHQLLFWNQGSYQILEGTLPKEIIHLNLPASSVIFEGIMRTQNREWILQHIGSPEAVYAIVSDFDDQNQVLKLPIPDVIKKMNGRRSLHEIAHMSDVETFEVCKAVVALEYLDLARPIQEEPLQMALSVPDSIEFAEAVQEEPTGAVREPDLESQLPEQKELGQVLQIPTVEELQRGPQLEEDEKSYSEEDALPKPFESVEMERPVFLEEEVEDSAPILSIPVETATPILTDAVDSGTEETAFVSPDEPVRDEPETVAVEPQPVAETVAQESETVLEEPGALPEAKQEASIPMQRLIRSSDSFSIRAVKEPRRKSLVTMLLVLVALALGGVYYRQQAGRSPQSTIGPKPGQQTPPVQTSIPAPVEPKPGESAPLVEPSPPPIESIPKGTPLRLLAEENIPGAARAWNAELSASKYGFSIQLVIACQEKTVKDTYRILGYSNEIIVLPLKFKGQNCYRVLFGRFSSRKLGKSATVNLPDVFLNQASPPDVVALARVVQ